MVEGISYSVMVYENNLKEITFKKVKVAYVTEEINHCYVIVLFLLEKNSALLVNYNILEKELPENYISNNKEVIDLAMGVYQADLSI